MSAITGKREEFKDYYKNLLKQPMTQNSERLAQIQETFKAVAALKYGQDLPIHFGTETIRAEDLGEREIDIFKRYVHKYAGQNPIAEEKVVQMLEDLNTCGFEKIKKQLLLNEIPENTASQEVSPAAKNALSKILLEQQQLIKQEKKGKRSTHIFCGIGLTLGSAALIGGIATAATFGMFGLGPLSLAFLGVGVVGIGASGFHLVNQRLNRLNIINNAFEKIEQIEKYKKLTEEEGFAALLKKINLIN